jgi:hypothetical protein
MSQKTDPQPNLFDRLVKSRPGSVIIKFLLTPAIILAVLFLPPISLNDRLLTIGYQPIDAAGASVQTSDGALMTFFCTCTGEQAWVRVEAVNPAALPNEIGGSSLQPATEALPDGLVLAGPLYHIQARGQGSVGLVKFAVPIPAWVEATQRLDLYAWNGQTWRWLPGEMNVANELVEAELDSVPEAVAIMEGNPSSPAISFDHNPDTNSLSEALETAAEINLTGFEAASDGEILGSESVQIPAELQSNDVAIFATIRNGEGTVGTAPNSIDDILTDPKVRRLHVEAIAELVEVKDFQGVDLDYRDIEPNLRQEFSLFSPACVKPCPTTLDFQFECPCLSSFQPAPGIPAPTIGRPSVAPPT